MFDSHREPEHQYRGVLKVMWLLVLTTVYNTGITVLSLQLENHGEMNLLVVSE